MPEAFVINCYLWANDVPWSEEQTDQLLDDLADWLAERGFGTEEGGNDIKSIISAGTQEVPDDEEHFVRQLAEEGVSRIILPRKV